VKKYRSSSIRSKWLKTHWLLKHQNLRKYIPKTMLFNKANLITMLSTYSTVYFKPTGGSGGFNIIRINKKPQGYQTQYNTAKSSFISLDQLYRNLSRFSNNRSFLLQKGIHLARTKGRPFDIRVMVQKTNNGAWVSTAIFTKIGKQGKVATNYNQGGKIGYFQPTMAGAGYDNETIQRSEADLKQLGVTVGKKLDRHIKGFRELGLDVALDSEGKPWILEVNTRPQFYPLKNMSNQKLYRRILTYAKQYGRYK
jgi:glutathione synthase/RimK-type ligase-like ATP-grasp enzyme